MPAWSMFNNDIIAKKNVILGLLETRHGLRGFPDRSSSYKEQAKKELAHRLALEEYIEDMTMRYNALLDKYEEAKDKG